MPVIGGEIQHEHLTFPAHLRNNNTSINKNVQQDGEELSQANENQVGHDLIAGHHAKLQEPLGHSFRQFQPRGAAKYY